MPEKPLDLEELADKIIRVEYPTYEQAPPGLKEAIIRKKMLIKQILERHTKQACEFYSKYRGKPDLLIEDYPEFKKCALKYWKWAIATGLYYAYDAWLAKLALGWNECDDNQVR